jgi:uncharacterized SAM-binding protein YcdF (DUF218 family)
MTIHDYFTLFSRVLLAVLCLLLVLAAAAFLFPQQVLTVDSGEVKAGALVLLGGGDDRAERCAQLYREGAAPAIIVTGYGDCQRNVETLEKLGVPSGVITPEPAALSTMQNASLSVPLLRAMRVHQIIIVTSWFHSRRALACFQHVAPDLTFYSRPSYFDYQPKSQNRVGYSWHVNYEYVKLVGYWFAHGVCPL